MVQLWRTSSSGGMTAVHDESSSPESSSMALRVEADAASNADDDKADASFWGAVARSLHHASRPLVIVSSVAAFKMKLYGVVLTKKFALAMRVYLLNPTKLFRRQALCPWEVI